MPSRWCPWCGSEIPAGAEGGPADVTCAGCGTRTPVAATLAAPPQRPLKPDDPEALLPPDVPEGAAPLPQGAPYMSVEALVRWAVIFGAVVLSIVVLSFAIGRPVLSLLSPTPAPATPTPSVPATPAPPPPTPAP